MAQNQKMDAHIKKRRILSVIGILLIIIGIILASIRAYHLGYHSMNFFNLSFDEHSYYSTVGFAFLAPGMFMILPGLFLLSVANMGKMARFTYEEGGRAMSKVSNKAIDGYGRVIGKSTEAMAKWVRSAGGINLDIDTNKEQVIKVRCRACDTLNDENAKFCDECGQPI